MSYGRQPWYIWRGGEELNISGPGILAHNGNGMAGTGHVELPEGAVLQFLYHLLDRYEEGSTIGDVLTDMQHKGTYR